MKNNTLANWFLTGFATAILILAFTLPVGSSETPRDDYRVVELHRSTDLQEVATWANRENVEIIQVFNLRAAAEPVMVLYRKK